MLILVLVSILAAAHANCDACIQGTCHSKRVVIEGFRITNHQLAIDRTDNILYVQIDWRTIAFFLDESKVRNVESETTHGLTVDQATQIFYSSEYTGNLALVNAYKYDQGVYTKKQFIYADPFFPERLRYEDTLYTVNANGSCGFMNKTSNSFTGYSNLENFKVVDMVNVRNATEWFFTSSNGLCKFEWDNKGKKSWDLISDKGYALSIDKYGDVYFGDVSGNVIYKLDGETKGMIKYATYINSSVDEFVFDRDNHIVFLDGYESVARWLPNGAPCTKSQRVESPGIGSPSIDGHRPEALGIESSRVDVNRPELPSKKSHHVESYNAESHRVEWSNDELNRVVSHDAELHQTDTSQSNNFFVKLV